MDYNLILKKVDHTVLNVDARWEDIKKAADDAVEYNAATICIPPSYVKKAKEYLQDRMKVCTVIGFPNGYSTTKTKAWEASDAIENGAEEIDMVINIGLLKDKRYADLKAEIATVKKACGEKILKVIVETSLLTEEEKIKMCHLVAEAGADYIKTSTGFSSGGATLEDVKLLSKHVQDSKVKVKASGGIRDLEIAKKYIDAGASRIGASRLITLIRDAEKQILKREGVGR